jgi:dolichyl-diphosphooligosaccharide--protein glycosyltransferase
LVEKIINGNYAREIKTPVYWVFTMDLFGKFAWIHYFGSYNFNKKEGTFGRIIAPQMCRILTENFIDCEDGRLSIDLKSGIITTPNGVSLINYLYLKTPDKFFQKKFYENGYIVEIAKGKNNQGQVFIIEPIVFKTLFNQMFVLRNYDSRYFELILDDFPYMVVYKVKENIR